MGRPPHGRGGREWNPPEEEHCERGERWAGYAGRRPAAEGDEKEWPLWVEPNPRTSTATDTSGKGCPMPGVVIKAECSEVGSD